MTPRANHSVCVCMCVFVCCVKTSYIYIFDGMTFIFWNIEFKYRVRTKETYFYNTLQLWSYNSLFPGGYIEKYIEIQTLCSRYYSVSYIRACHFTKKIGCTHHQIYWLCVFVCGSVCLCLSVAMVYVSVCLCVCMCVCAHHVTSFYLTLILKWFPAGLS